MGTPISQQFGVLNFPKAGDLEGTHHKIWSLGLHFKRQKLKDSD